MVEGCFVAVSVMVWNKGLKLLGLWNPGVQVPLNPQTLNPSSRYGMPPRLLRVHKISQSCMMHVDLQPLGFRI